MADAGCVGTYGTIKLLKRNKPDVCLAPFPVDTDVVTIGRDKSCDIRLYYTWVSSVHCKIILEERKAYLQVLGLNGALVDGCPVFPASTPGAPPTTVPLVNGGRFEIEEKLFEFHYPPKDMRPPVYTSPQVDRRRSLRLSMIQSAQVFSPRPFNNPHDNLRVLQSPLRPFMNTTSPIKDDEVVTLVDGDHPHVMEEDKDLVIVEDVAGLLQQPVLPPSPTPPVRSSPVMPSPLGGQISPSPPRTNRRKSAPSLHRAVLLRSAQRAQMMHEAYSKAHNRLLQARATKSDDDDEEELEVERSMSADPFSSSESDEQDEDEDPVCIPQDVPLDEPQNDVLGEGEERDITEVRHALSEIILSDVDDLPGVIGKVDEPQQDEEEDEGSVEPVPVLASFQSRGRAARVSTTPAKGPMGRGNLGPFMTPQVYAGSRPRPVEKRLSLGHGLMGGPQRVRVADHWKITDILESSEASSEGDSNNAAFEDPVDFKTPKAAITAEERQAIMRRRKSAFVDPDHTLDHVPGTRRTSILPSPPISPLKRAMAGAATPSTQSGTPEEDTKSMLAKMRETVDNMRRKTLNGLGEFGSILLANGGSDTLDVAQAEETSSKGHGMTFTLEDENESQEEDDREDQDDEHEEAEEDRKGEHRLQPSTPRMDGLRDMFRAPVSCATPTFTGVREMFQNPRQAPKTPHYNGIKRLYPEVPISATPSMAGIRSMFREVKVTQTPTYEGLGEMLALPEADEELAEGDIVDAAVEGRVDRPVAHKAASHSARSRIPSTDISAMADDETTDQSIVAPPRRAGRAPKGSGQGKGVKLNLAAKGSVFKKASIIKEVEEAEVTEKTVDEKPAAKPRRRAAPVKQSTEAASGTTEKRTATRTRSKTETDASSSEAKTTRRAPQRSATTDSTPPTRRRAAAPATTADETEHSDGDPLDSITKSETTKIPQAKRGLRVKTGAVPAPAAEEKPKTKKTTRSRAAGSPCESDTTASVDEQDETTAPAAATRKRRTKAKEGSPETLITEGDKENASATDDVKVPRKAATKASVKNAKADVVVAPPVRMTRARTRT